MTTTAEWLAIYEHRFNICQSCIDSIEEDAEAYRQMYAEEPLPALLAGRAADGEDA